MLYEALLAVCSSVNLPLYSIPAHKSRTKMRTYAPFWTIQDLPLRCTDGDLASLSSSSYLVSPLVCLHTVDYFGFLMLTVFCFYINF